MGGAIFDFFIFLIVVVLVAMLILWCVRYFFPDIYPPARYVVGGVALILILYALKPVFVAGVPGMP